MPTASQFAIHTASHINNSDFKAGDSGSLILSMFMATRQQAQVTNVEGLSEWVGVLPLVNNWCRMQ